MFSEVMPQIPTVMIGITAISGVRIFFMESPAALKMLARLWVVLFAIELIGTWIGFYYSNEWLHNIFHGFFIISLCFIFSQVLQSDRLKAVIQVFITLFAVFVLMNSLFLQGITELQTLTYVIGGVFIIFLGGAYFWQLLMSNDNEKITRDPFFWLSFGLIVYYGGTVPYFGMWNYLQANFLEFTEFYFMFIYKSFSVFLNILVLIAFLCRRNYLK